MKKKKIQNSRDWNSQTRHSPIKILKREQLPQKRPENLLNLRTPPKHRHSAHSFINTFTIHNSHFNYFLRNQREAQKSAKTDLELKQRLVERGGDRDPMASHKDRRRDRSLLKRKRRKIRSHSIAN